MKVKSVTFSEWQQFVEGLSNYTFFHLPIWAQLYEKIYPNCRIATKMFIFDDGVQVLVPLVEKNSKFGFKSYASLPEGAYGGFVWNTKPSEQQLQRILSHLLSMKTLRLTIYPNPLEWEEMQFLEKVGFENANGYAHILTLDGDYEYIWKNRITSKNRNQTRKAIKSGLVIRRGNDINDIKSYYALYLASAERWNAKADEIRPLELYKELFELGRDNVRLYIASKDGVDIAVTISLYDANTVYYWGGAILKEYGQYCPNNLLHNEVIKDACESGYKYYNMLSSGGLSGVEKFKESFGTERINYKYFVYENPLLKVYRKINLTLRLKEGRALEAAE
jgi:hypothetical protein